MKKAAAIGVFCLLVAAASALVTVTFLPFVQTTWWIIRLMDFPRLLFLAGLIVVALSLLPFAWLFPRTTGVVGAGVVAALVTNAVILWPYWPSHATAVASCPAERTLSVMIANVQLGNRESAPLLQALADQKPDLFLAMETDEWWDDALRPVTADMPHTVQKITGSYYGIHFFSRLPLVDPTIHVFAGRDTPSVVTGVTLRNGETVSFVGMHPKPPIPGQSSAGRDAELYAAGQMLRDQAGPALLAGDLNSTPWEQAVERMRRIAGLDDPRRGYGYVASWNAKRWWERWPLDNIFIRGGFDLLSLDRLTAFGSDHFPYIVRLCRRTGTASPASTPESEDDKAAIRGAFAGAGVPQGAP